MEVSFATSKLKKICESQKELQRTHGEACAKRIMQRLADLRAAPSLEEMRALPGGCHELKGDRAGQLALELPDGKRLVFEPAPKPTGRGPRLDWRTVDSVCVAAIEDYH